MMSKKEVFIKGAKNLFNSFKYAFWGIYKSFKSERNMKIHCLAVILVIILGFVYQISMIEWYICFILFGVVISAELFNTAIETVVNMVMPYKNEKAGLAKDIAAGAVLVLAIVAAIIVGFIFIPKIF